MAMRYNRLFVYLGSMSALVVMTVLSVCIGVAVPALLPRAYTHYLAAALFAYFGARLLYEATQMQPGNTNEELQEAEEHLAEKGLGVGGHGAESNRKEDEDEEEGRAGGGAEAGSASGADSVGIGIGDASGAGASQRYGKAAPAAAASAAPLAAAGGAGSAVELAVARDWPILVQAFTITFVAEWGDRSQIATIAMAAAQEPFGVTLGACIGHALCTGLAVMGGRLLATRISERAVAFSGGVLFVLFAIHSLVVGPDAAR
jgi:hypothetical protein